MVEKINVGEKGRVFTAYAEISNFFVSKAFLQENKLWNF